MYYYVMYTNIVVYRGMGAGSMCVHAVFTHTRKRRSLAGKHAVSLSVADATEIERDATSTQLFQTETAATMTTTTPFSAVEFANV